MVQFIREDKLQAGMAIAQTIAATLHSRQRVLWLVSGGSNISIEVAVMKLLHNDTGADLASLAIMPMDERFGSAGHKDSNSEALRVAGFNPGAATWVDVLTHNVSFEQTADFYNDVAQTALEGAYLVVGQFGMGTDGHIAGLKPNSPAVQNSQKTVLGYEWIDYQRLTLTPTALKRVNVAYMLVYGEPKKPALQRMQAHNEPLQTLPANLLYEIPNVYVYNDTIESEE